MEQNPEWIAKVYCDWTILQVLELGLAFAFNRETGRVYKLPSNECPFVQMEINNDQLLTKRT